MYKNSEHFRREFPGAYVKSGDVYDSNNTRIGYQTGDGDIRIIEKGPNDGQLYHFH